MSHIRIHIPQSFRAGDRTTAANLPVKLKTVSLFVVAAIQIQPVQTLSGDTFSETERIDTA